MTEHFIKGDPCPLMKHKIPIMALVAVLIALLAAPMLMPEVQAAEQPNVGEIKLLFEGLPVVNDPLDPEYNPIRLNAGEEVEIRVVITNTSSAKWSATINAKDSENVNYIGTPQTRIIEASDFDNIDMKFSTDKFTRQGVGDLTIKMHIIGDISDYTVTETVHFEISSNLSASGYFNKIMGVFPNTLPEPFDNPIASAIITMVIWFLIAVLMIKAIIPGIMHFPLRGRKTINRNNVKSARKMIFSVVIIYGFYEALKVLGASEYVIDFSGRVAAILYVLLGALLLWEIYLVVVEHVFSRRGPDGGPGVVDQTLIPLFNMIGKIIIVTIAVAFIFSLLGADLVGIVAGAGIAGLALSLGAQSMLRQFFSGITLLTTRPFKEGDYVKIDNSVELKVQKVGIMTTWFKTPWNEEIITMPNDKVASSYITNMTGENLIYRFNLFLEVTRDTDITLAKKLLSDAAMEHPGIIKDGTVFMPFARATDITPSGIKIRLAAFVYNYEDSWGIEASLRERALKEFKENGIKMAYQTLDVRSSIEKLEPDI